MPYPSTFMYLTVIGDAYASAERWQFGLKLTDGGVNAQTTALAAAPIVERWWRATSPYVFDTDGFAPPTTHRLTEVKAARIGTDGKYVPGTTSYSHFYVPPIAGTAAKLSGQSAQQTVCVTLTTAKPRGHASKGRIFLPPSVRYDTSSDGLMAATNATVIANSVKRLINELNADGSLGTVAIFSRGKGEPTYDADQNQIEYTFPNPGAVENVTGVRVGRVIDTQRRRRRSLAEGYQAVTL